MVKRLEFKVVEGKEAFLSQGGVEKNNALIKKKAPTKSNNKNKKTRKKTRLLCAELRRLTE